MIHRMIARLYSPYLGRDKRFATAAEVSLPGGETTIDDNYLRLGQVNRSITSQVVLAFDDVGYSANTSSVYRSDPFFANGVVAADSLRVTASRLREDAATTISLLTQSFRVNMTALNQGDHCIVVRPRAVGVNPLPTVNQGNQVLNPENCERFEEPAGLFAFFVSVLQANAGQLGGVLQTNAFTPGELATVARQSATKAIATVNATQVATVQTYQMEAARLTEKRGVAYPTTVAMAAQANAGAQSVG